MKKRARTVKEEEKKGAEGDLRDAERNEGKRGKRREGKIWD